MNIDEKAVPLLTKIDFPQRYLSLCEKYPYWNSKSLEPNNVEELLKILTSYNSQIKYVKNERFFKLKEKVLDFDIQFNIIIKYEVIQLVWDLIQNKNRITLGLGMWESITSELMDIEFEIQPRPCFHDYVELKEILTVAFSIYEDFKQEIVREFGGK